MNRSELISNRSSGVFLAKEYAFTIKSHSLTAKFCGNCSLYRPARSVHCYTCGVCVLKMDHHCPWLGLCVGSRNYSLYLLYVLSMEVTAGLICGQVLAYLVQGRESSEGEFVLNILLGKLRVT